MNNQEVTKDSSGSRIIIVSGKWDNVDNRLNTTSAKYDYFIRIGDTGNPVANDGDILIGYGYKNQSTGEAGIPSLVIEHDLVV